MFQRHLVLRIVALILLGSASGCVTSPVAGDDYYSLGAANFELKKYELAEYWFLKSRLSPKTQAAADYYLGRIAFEQADYQRALTYFEGLLAKDPDNLILLKATAFSSLKLGDHSKAISIYERVTELVPSGPDVNYNYALLLYLADRPDRATTVLKPYLATNRNDKDAWLLLARSEAALRQEAAIESFKAYLNLTDDPLVQRELAETCEALELYGQAAEQYQQIIATAKATIEGLNSTDIQFALARVLFLAEAEGASDALSTALAKGFKEPAALEGLLADPRISLTEADQQLIAETLDPTLKTLPPPAEYKLSESDNDTDQTVENQPAESTD